MGRLNISLLILMALIFIGCTKSPIPQDRVSSIQRVGVVATNWHNLYLNEFGITTYGTYFDIVDVAMWDTEGYIDSYISNKLSQQVTVELIDSTDIDILMIPDDVDNHKRYIKSLMQRYNLDTIIRVNGSIDIVRTKPMFAKGVQKAKLPIAITFYQLDSDGEIDTTLSKYYREFGLSSIYWHKDTNKLNIPKLQQLKPQYHQKIKEILEEFLTYNKF
jgi:hypothetical protein